MPTSVNGHAGKPYSFRQRQATDYLALNNGPAAEDDDDGATHGTRTGASVTARGVGHASLISSAGLLGGGTDCDLELTVPVEKGPREMLWPFYALRAHRQKTPKTKFRRL